MSITAAKVRAPLIADLARYSISLTPSPRRTSFPFVAATLAASRDRYTKSIGEARLMAGNAIRMMARAPKSRAGCHFAAAIGLRSLLENFAPTIPDWALDQHTLNGIAWVAVWTTSAAKVRSWYQSRPSPIRSLRKRTGCGRSSSAASKPCGRRSA